MPFKIAGIGNVIGGTKIACVISQSGLYFGMDQT